MNENEKILVEAIGSFLKDKAKLGLNTKNNKDNNDNDPKNRGQQYLHGQIDDMFALKSADLTHQTGICAAFSKVHGYKYIDDDTFAEAMDKEMTAQAIPANERKKALEIIPKIIKELSDEKADWSEQDFGFNNNMDEIITGSQPQQYQ